MFDLFWTILSFISAPAFGSFAALAADRLPVGQPVLRGRSRCDACGQTLAWYELVPLISYLVQGGRCRRCGSAIPFRLFGGELACLLLTFQASLILSGPMLFLTTALAAWLVAITLIDVAHYVVPDVLSLPLVLAGLLLVFLWPGLAWQPPLYYVAGAAAGYGALWAIGAAYKWLRGREGVGLGDAKLLAAAGAWLGIMELPFVLLAASLMGLLAVGLAAVLGRQIKADQPVAFGPFIAAGFWLSWLYGPYFL